MPGSALASPFLLDAINVADARSLLGAVEPGSVAAVFFDPQYRSVLSHLAFGNEGAKQRERCLLQQMSAEVIGDCLALIGRALRPSGHLFLWSDKFELVEGTMPVKAAGLHPVDLLTWDKQRFGLGYRSRRCCEDLVVAQRPPRRVKGAWKDRGIRDVWSEQVVRGGHPHGKPVGLLTRLIAAVTEPDDLVMDPCAGGYAVLEAVRNVPGRRFLGCDLVAPPVERRRALAGAVIEPGL